MDVELQKSLFTSPLEDELKSPAFKSDDNLNKEIRWILHQPIYLLIATLISLFNIITHLLVMIQFSQYDDFMDYFWCSFGILLLTSLGNSIMFTMWKLNDRVEQNGAVLCMNHILLCTSILPIAIILPCMSSYCIQTKCI